MDVNDGPLGCFVPIEPFVNVSEEQGKVAVVTFLSAEVFQVVREPSSLT